MILSGEMMLRYLNWHEAADLIITALNKTIAQKRVTYDFHRMTDGAALPNRLALVDEYKMQGTL